EIAMDHAMAMRVIERAGDGGGNADRFADGQLALAHQSIAKRLAFDERHDVVEERAAPVALHAAVIEIGDVYLSRIEQREEVWMLKIRRHADLGEESLHPEDDAELRVEDLERDETLVLEVARPIDHRHTTGADLLLDFVAASERRV